MEMSTSLSRIKRRIVKRHPAEVRVYLSTSEGYKKCRTRNISRGGVFVETDFRGYFGGDSVELVFVQPQGDITRMRRYVARVVHRAFHGLGLKFSKPEAAAPSH